MDTIALARDEEWCSRTDRLVADLSSTLIHLPGEDVAASIDAALAQIGEALHVDRATLLEFGDDPDRVEAAYHWVRPALAPVEIESDVAPLRALLDCLRMEDEPVVLERIPEDLPDEVLTPEVREYLQRTPMKSAVAVPVAIGGQTSCALAVGVFGEPCTWSEEFVERLRLLAQILAGALYRRRQDQALRQSRREIARLSETADGEARVVTPQASIAGFEEIIGDSPTLRAALARLQEVASSDCTVLLLGETGTGKELFAKALHDRGPRRQYPLVSVNCAALPPTLIESEMFGHERGAFTGAVAQRQGRFEAAHRGTLFLDEIGDLPLDLQAKLLRVLQEGEFERLGASHTRRVDVRIVAATHCDLDEAVAEGRFRDDLYYRLNVFPIRLPPLRERRADIPALAWFLIQKRQRAMHRWIKRVPQGVMDLLQRHNWPGNIRELENVIERALIHSTGDTLLLRDDDIEAASPAVGDGTTLFSVERAHIEEVLRECGWRINGAGNAAERLGLHPNTLRFRMKKLGIVRVRAPVTPIRQPLTRFR